MPRGIYPRKKETMSKSKTIDATSESIEGREREFSVGEVAVSGPPPIEVASVDVLKGTGIEQEKFMADVLEVFLHERSGENEPTLAFVGVNGEQMWLERGRSYQLKRSHVAVLAQAKSGRVSQRKVVAPDGSQSYIEAEVTSLAYPFSVMNDPNPRGSAWLRETLKRAA